MDIKEIALKVADSLRNKIDGISHMQSNQGLVTFAEALISAYKVELLKEVGEPELYGFEDGELVCAQDMVCMAHKTGQRVTPFYTSDQVAAAILKATGPLDKPIDTALAAEIERTDWTPAEALQFYADQRNFDIVGGHARIIDNGAVASNALKHLSIDRLELKGDAELAELRAQLAAAQEEIESNKAYFTTLLEEQRVLLTKAEQREEWQPIETAPKGEAFLAVLSCGDHQTVCTMRWPVAEAKNSRVGNGEFILERVTHWMPLPKAPNTASS